MDKQLFRSNPRAFALDLVEQGLVSADHLLLCALNYMSHDDVCDMLDSNELSPRFDEEEDEEPALSQEMIDHAVENGTAWGHNEAELWRDQHPTGTPPEWTYGEWSGTFPDEVSDDDKLCELYETALDVAAKNAWDECFKTA